LFVEASGILIIRINQVFIHGMPHVVFPDATILVTGRDGDSLVVFDSDAGGIQWCSHWIDPINVLRSSEQYSLNRIDVSGARQHVLQSDVTVCCLIDKVEPCRIRGRVVEPLVGETYPAPLPRQSVCHLNLDLLTEAAHVACGGGAGGCVGYDTLSVATVRGEVTTRGAPDDRERSSGVLILPANDDSRLHSVSPRSLLL